MSGQQHLLLVEDDREWREGVGHVARAAGFSVSLATDGAEALDWLGRNPRHHHPDLILMDMVPPRVEGWALYGRLRTDAALRHLPLMLMSSTEGPPDMALGGVVGILRRPERPEALAGTLYPHLRDLRLRERPETPAPYALRLPDESLYALHALPAPVRHAVRLHLLRAAELAATEAPRTSHWLMALPSAQPSLLVTVEGVRVVLEVDDAARALTASLVIIPSHLRGA
ncbi:response regulator [Corallococcus sp. H22C18031201]|uniref:response regulator n=1 Tax=Citreicoccus inhibens TaxID=2849499 RepID=UPI000E734C11|nr:response regulator [Citreicoccus inhibens]MBU8900124.1 response regulator [Citreicoccus inhibens]RJS21765.1 response regulator [Corallococcus sp. H22C18031201]